MNPYYEKEVEALKLLHKDWDNKSEDEKRGLHHTLMWTIEAVVDVGLLDWVDQ